MNMRKVTFIILSQIMHPYSKMNASAHNQLVIQQTYMYIKKDHGMSL